MHIQEVIVRALLSEKSMKESENGRYTFLVDRRANKGDVKRAVEALFQVNVVSVVTTTQKGKTTRVGMRRIEVVKSPFKKAAVRLKAGQTLGGAADEPAKSDTKEKKEKPAKKGVRSLLTRGLSGVERKE